MAEMLLIGVLLYMAACAGLLLKLILRNRSHERVLPEVTRKGKRPTHSQRAA